MIMTVAELKKQVNCGSDSDDLITTKLKAIESVIRAFTNNNFQNRAIRMVGRASGMNVYGVPQYFHIGDTVQITASGVNDGLYEVTDVTDDHIQLDTFVKTTDVNCVTKIEYPADVVQCVVDLYQWKMNMGEKVGIKSETLSRHSVTYEDSATLFMGYPVGILNGLKLHKKARC